MAVTAILANLSCSDIEIGKAWYTHLFGRSPDASPSDDLLEWYLGPDVGFQLILDAGNAGRGSVTLRVTPLDPELERLGLVSAEDVDRGADTRHLRLKDPDGNLLLLVESA